MENFTSAPEPAKDGAARTSGQDAASNGNGDVDFETTREIWLNAERRYDERPQRKSRDRPSFRAPAAEGDSYYEGIKKHPQNGLIPELIEAAREALRKKLQAARNQAGPATKADAVSDD